MGPDQNQLQSVEGFPSTSKSNGSDPWKEHVRMAWNPKPNQIRKRLSSDFRPLTVSFASLIIQRPSVAQQNVVVLLLT